MNTPQPLTHKRQSIGREKAIALAKSGWWKGKPAKEVARAQLFTNELMMDLSDFHKALEESLGRPVWTHELALNWNGLACELMDGAPSPTMDEIINLIPEEKRIIVTP